MFEQIYFFSRHNPDPKMFQDLGKHDLFCQIAGTISNVRQDDDGNLISFTEADSEGNIIKRYVPRDAIIIAVAPLPLQEAWLKAGAKTLLIPQNNRETTPEGKVVFNYAGLLQVHSIRVVTSQWSGATVRGEQKVKKRAALPSNK